MGEGMFRGGDTRNIDVAPQTAKAWKGPSLATQLFATWVIPKNKKFFNNMFIIKISFEASRYASSAYDTGAIVPTRTPHIMIP
jgi:hypothetical protein